MNSIGKMLMVLGLLIFLTGGFFALGGKIPWLGKLPGDIYIKKDNFTFFFPFTTSIIISLVLSMLFVFLRKR